jgi:hypothetical protein
MSAVTGDAFYDDRGNWLEQGGLGRRLIISGVVGSVVAAAAAGVILTVYPLRAAAMVVLLLCIGFIEFAALLSIGLGIASHVLWRRRQAFEQGKGPD